MLSTLRETDAGRGIDTDVSEKALPTALLSQRALLSQSAAFSARAGQHAGSPFVGCVTDNLVCEIDQLLEKKGLPDVLLTDCAEFLIEILRCKTRLGRRARCRRHDTEQALSTARLARRQHVLQV